jgi:lysophospholipase L1-like esterase
MPPPYEASPSTRRARNLYRAVTVVFWLIVLALALELAERARWAYLVQTNPYLQARKGGRAWPHPDRVYTPEAMATPMRSRGISPAPLEPRDAASERMARAAYYLTLPPELQQRFEERFEWLVMPVSNTGDIVPPPPPELADATASALQAIQSTGTAACSGGGDEPMVCAHPTGGGRALITAHPAPGAPPRDPETIWEYDFAVYKPHRCDPGGVLCTNDRGFRDDDSIVPKPGGVFRVVCVGGSTTEEGLHNATTFPNRTQALLNERLATDAVDVVNAGISGSNSELHPLRLGAHLELEPDLLLYYLGVNDLSYRVLRLWVAELSLLRRAAGTSRLLTRHAGALFRPSEEELRALVDEFVFPNLDHIADRAAAEGIALAFASFAAPDPDAFDAAQRAFFNISCEQDWTGRYINFDTYLWALELYNDWLQAWCKERGLHYIPVAEQLKGGAEYFLDICHMRNNGIERKAEITAGYIEQHWGETIRELK